MKLLKKLKKKRRKSGKAHSEYSVMAGLLSGHPVGVIFDVGANHGHVSKVLLDTLKPKQLFAFEPFAETAESLRTNLAPFANVEIRQMAVGNFDGEVDLNINKNTIYNNSLLDAADGADKWHDIDHVAKQTVKSTRIDSFCDAEGISEIDVLKVDAEGADFLVVEGAERMLAEKKVKMVYVEVLLTDSFVGQASLGRFIEFFEGHGYELCNFFGHKIDENGRLFRTDVLFVDSLMLT